MNLRLPCIICENGDPYSNIVCDDCECKIEPKPKTKPESSFQVPLNDVLLQANVLQITLIKNDEIVKAFILNRDLNHLLIESQEEPNQITRTESDYKPIAERIKKRSLKDFAKIDFELIRKLRAIYGLIIMKNELDRKKVVTLAVVQTVLAGKQRK